MPDKKKSHSLWFQTQVLTWFDQYGRKMLPWQKNISAYRVWVSEVMLQQTQVTTVIPYFERFMLRFPKIENLAEASVDEVLHYWTGLGYYARGRNLHKAAKMIVDTFHGQFPASYIDIIELPGIGRSTAGAILSIAYHDAHPILDGNVKRVLARYAGVAGYPGDKKVADELWTLAETLTPIQRVADYTQAMMDLGATLCTKSKPQCDKCPVSMHCHAYQSKTISQYPGKKPKKILPVKQTIMLILQQPNGDILLEKKQEGGLWNGLWLLPQCNTDQDITAWCLLHQFKIANQTVLAAFRHTFSHFHLDITPVLIKLAKQKYAVSDSNQFMWYDSTQQVGLAAPIKKILESLKPVK